MSNAVNHASLWKPPRHRLPLLDVTEQNVADFWNLFVNRRAYTCQNDRADPKTKRHNYYPPRNRRTNERLGLDRTAVGKHLAGLITIGLYAIQPETQSSKWVAIDADYTRAPYDLKGLKDELREDGVEALEEMSRRGGHLWIFCEEPLPARECKIYIYNLALQLGVPIRGAQGLKEGIEVFPRQENLGPGEFGNAIRGPLGIHRANSHRYWFYGAPTTLVEQLAYLKSAKKLTADELRRFTAGMTLPEEFTRTRVEPLPANYKFDGNEFRILDHVEIRARKGKNYLARCPSCAEAGKDRHGDNLAISIANPLMYHCFARCKPKMIRAALGHPIPERK